MSPYRTPAERTGQRWGATRWVRFVTWLVRRERREMREVRRIKRKHENLLGTIEVIQDRILYYDIVGKYPEGKS